MVNRFEPYGVQSYGVHNIDSSRQNLILGLDGSHTEFQGFQKVKLYQIKKYQMKIVIWKGIWIRE